jgi:hypothetical protein
MIRQGHSSAEANCAIQGYIDLGPSAPYNNMDIEHLDSLRVKAFDGHTLHTYEAAGWIAVDLATAVSQQSKRQEEFPIPTIIENAEESFTYALDTYIAGENPPEQQLRLELALAALPLYASLVTCGEITAQEVETFHEDVVETGHKVSDTLSDCSPRHKKGVIGLAAEVNTILAYNRRRQPGAAVETLALPSTYRQDKSAGPGSLSGDSSARRGNWDVSVISQTPDSGWDFVDKVQVKSSTQQVPPTSRNSRYTRGGRQSTREYTDDITVAGFRQLTHERFGVWKGLLALANIPGLDLSPGRRRFMSRTVSNSLYKLLENEREHRAQLENPILHSY